MCCKVSSLSNSPWLCFLLLFCELFSIWNNLEYMWQHLGKNNTQSTLFPQSHLVLPVIPVWPKEGQKTFTVTLKKQKLDKVSLFPYFSGFFFAFFFCFLSFENIKNRISLNSHNIVEVLELSFLIHAVGLFTLKLGKRTCQ